MPEASLMLTALALAIGVLDLRPGTAPRRASATGPRCAARIATASRAKPASSRSGR